jgi:hypothetical protein
VDVSGTVENSTNVTVNNLIASVNGNTFSSQLTFKEGANTILAIATDPYGRTASDDVTVRIVVPVKGTVTGTVVNGLTGSPLPSAIVSITDAKGNVQTITTTASGAFSVELAEGAYSGTVIKPWYLSLPFAGSVTPGEKKVINAALTPIEPVISNIHVTDITESSAKISWATDQLTQSLVEYGTTTSYASAAPDLLEETTHSVTLTNLTPSTTYHFRIVASSNNGPTTYSSDRSFKTNGQILITIDSPANGADISGNSVTVTGSISNPANVETGVTVNGMAASLNDNQFAVNNVSLNAGQNTITVTATDVNGTTASQSITVNATIPENFITLSAYLESGVAPLEVTLRINGTFSIAKPIMTSTGPGIVEPLESENPDEYKYKMIAAGVYYFTAQVTGPDGNIYQDTKAVTVLPFAQVDALLKEKWTKLTNLLNRGDTASALSLILPSKRVNYEIVFNLLKNQWPAIIATYSNFSVINIEDAIAKYELSAMKNGKTYVYQIDFIKDSSGLWLINEF